MSSRISSLMAVLASLMAASASSADFVVAVRGEPAACTVVLPGKPSPSCRYAAQEFIRCVKAMTGVTLPSKTAPSVIPARAVILSGSDREDDVFRLECKGDRLHVRGGKRGVLYGVYELLERFGGCGWYASWREILPERKEFAVPEGLDETHRPAFEMRAPFWYDMFNADFAAKCRANGVAMNLKEKHGGCTGRFDRYLGHCHTFKWLLPVEEYFDAHPEYFSEINGKRTKKATQLCLSNPDVLRIVTEKTLERIRANPEIKFYGISHNDWRNWCTCAKCSAVNEEEGGPTGSELRFVNKVAEAVEKEFPDVMIEMLAYQYTQKPPLKTRPRRNVMPCLCSIKCDFSRPISDGGYAENEQFLKDIRRWSEISPKLYVWDYCTDFDHYPAPFPNIPALQGNLKLFRDCKVSMIFDQGAYQGRHGEFAELKAWLLAKLMWNPDQPVEPLIAKFLDGYYGPAAPLVKEYLTALCAVYSKKDSPPLRVGDKEFDLQMSDEFLAWGRKLWEKAEAAVKGDDVLTYNVEMSAFSVRYLQMIRKIGTSPRTLWVASDPQSFTVEKKLREDVKWLLDRVEKGRIRLAEAQRNVPPRLECWRKLAADKVPLKGTDRIVVPAEELALAGAPGSYGKLIDDASATSGKALKLKTNQWNWAVRLRFLRLAYDADCEYRLRMRIKGVRRGSGEAFRFGIYDGVTRKHAVPSTIVSADEVKDGVYEWLDVGTVKPADGMAFFMAPGQFAKASGEKPALKDIYVDAVEVAKVIRK